MLGVSVRSVELTWEVTAPERNVSSDNEHYRSQSEWGL